ncbi:hypothetical protein HELRODRAFT_176465 [Helobdella robusta]|uniref:Ig-like domain-containing protein n=1 Tax=Helobdella robusta TaxID=6412 RepID=T1FAJ3_HELRO|nr:hypothetical protein HELRODRAFT_176465 [Helobdella robusta]ESN99705.1 hypothetical protein HELRODRAFT_176465 [Helobdella robusta]
MPIARVQNVRFAKSTVNLGEPLVCLSDSEPDAHHWTWTVRSLASRHFRIKHNYIKFRVYGTFEVKCEAFNKIGDENTSDSYVASISVVGAVHDVRFDKKTIKVGGTIKCLSTSGPRANRWTWFVNSTIGYKLDRDVFIISRNTMTFMREGVYKLICIAYNKISGNMKFSFSASYIRVLGWLSKILLSFCFSIFLMP